MRRRNFLGAVSAGIGGVWLTGHWPDIAAAADAASRAVADPGAAALQVLSQDEKVEIDAIASRILPSDDGPGAREAGVVYFIDRALGTFAGDARPLVSAGLATLSATVKTTYPDNARFSALEPDAQDRMLQTIESDAFFQFVRWGTIAGFLANPSYGGNRGKVGWRWIGFEDRFVWQEPFGYYDREDSGGS